MLNFFICRCKMELWFQFWNVIEGIGVCDGLWAFMSLFFFPFFFSYENKDNGVGMEIIEGRAWGGRVGTISLGNKSTKKGRQMLRVMCEEGTATIKEGRRGVWRIEDSFEYNFDLYYQIKHRVEKNGVIHGVSGLVRILIDLIT